MTPSEQSDSAQPALASAEAMQHLRDLMLHRPGDELVIVLHPERCAWCRELAEAWMGTTEGKRS